MDDVPWGHVCGYPTKQGDLYGGAMYLASAAETPQSRAIREASLKFGNGATLPFTPCKKGYIPVVGGIQLYACPLHTKQRERRVKREGRRFRNGEVDLNCFWVKHNGKGKNPNPG